MALEEDVVAAARVILAAEEVVEADLVERGGRGVGGDVSAHPDPRALGAGDHDGGVPAVPSAVGALGVLVAREVGLVGDVDGVDVGRRRLRGDGDVLAPCLRQHRQQDEAGTGATLLLDEGVKGLAPLPGLLGVVVGDLGQEAVDERRGVTGRAHGFLFPRFGAVAVQARGGVGPASPAGSHGL
ncbi:MAG: hypothetical protein Q605_AUC00765G0005 [Actinomyces urogenitalis DORA_12]|uniref:Uncharacterized protein n=1 Tax=Actinomyces urogenitalis DORA_12 TaxID=1403939 RepID=W1VE32_9ACTO|nr:MAG: hypothetical protein Q605_AUC00765G0005 [Actinomyces urogenitalis DORA_12]